MPYSHGTAPDHARLPMRRAIFLFAQLVLMISLPALSTRAEEPITSSSLKKENPQWSPSGTWIVYERTNAVSGKKEIYRVSPSDPFVEFPVVTNPNPDPATHVNFVNPRWSSDGLWITFARQVEPTSCLHEIWIAEATGLVNAQLTKRSATPDNFPSMGHAFPRWSPDDKWIIFERQKQTVTAAVYKCLSGINPGSGTVTLLPPNLFPVAMERCSFATNSTGPPECNRSVQRPIWSPGGKWVSVIRETGGTEFRMQRVFFSGHAFGGFGTEQEGMYFLSTHGVQRGPMTLAVDTVDEAKGAEWRFDSQRLVAPTIIMGEQDNEIATFPFEPGLGQVLTDNDVEDSDPAWYPASAPTPYIVFVRFENTAQIWAVLEDGTSEILVSDQPQAEYSSPTWNPSNGTQIASIRTFLSPFGQVVIDDIP